MCFLPINHVRNLAHELLLGCTRPTAARTPWDSSKTTRSFLAINKQQVDKHNSQALATNVPLEHCRTGALHFAETRSFSRAQWD